MPGMEIFVNHVAEMHPGTPLNPTKSFNKHTWALDYLFTPGQIQVSRDPWETRPPDTVYLLPRYASWRERPVGRRPVRPHRCQIEFATRLSQMLEERLLHKKALSCVRFADPDHVIANAMIEIAATARALTDAGYWTVHALVWDLLQSLFEAPETAPGHFEVRAERLRRPLDPVIPRALAYFQQHLADDITLPAIAAHLRLAPSTLSHRFHKALGRGPMKELQRLRLVRAKAMLAQGYKLEAIARATGFYDGLYLSRIFKQCEGLSPTAFIARHPTPAGEPAE